MAAGLLFRVFKRLKPDAGAGKVVSDQGLSTWSTPPCSGPSEADLVPLTQKATMPYLQKYTSSALVVALHGQDSFTSVGDVTGGRGAANQARCAELFRRTVGVSTHCSHETNTADNIACGKRWICLVNSRVPCKPTRERCMRGAATILK